MNYLVIKDKKKLIIKQNADTKYNGLIVDKDNEVRRIKMLYLFMFFNVRYTIAIIAAPANIEFCIKLKL